MKQRGPGHEHYQVGGALSKDFPAYVKRDADEQFYQALKAEEFCYVLNSRQMGKTSLMVRTLDRLKSEGWAGVVLDFSAKDSQGAQAERWYNGIINQLNRQFGLHENSRSWIRERDFLSPVERLGEYLETVLLEQIHQPIVLFIDEIDSTLSLLFTDDFFALIRACYNKRAEKPNYQRLTFALLGVAAPSELIGDKKRTPFNIGKAIDLRGFQSQEAQPLVAGLEEKAENPQVVLREILGWTGGQPFLTQRLCQLVVDRVASISNGDEAQVIEQLAQTYLIENWESQDEQEHLKTIRNRLLSNEQKAGYLLELYRRIRQANTLKCQNTSEERDLQLSGLVVKRDDHLTVYNPIYAQVFTEDWIDGELGKLRPYAETFRAWVVSGKTDRSRLLRGDALVEAEEWSAAKNLSGEDRDFLAASRTQAREEEIAEKEQEAELEREKKAREAAEEAEKIQAIANQKAQRRIRLGSIILGVTLLLSLGSGIWAFTEGRRATNAQKIAQQAKDDVKKAQSELESAQEKFNALENQVSSLDEEREDATKKLGNAQKKLKKAETKLKGAEINQREAETYTQRARDRSKRAMSNMRLAQQQKQQAKNELANAQTLVKKAQNDLAAAQQARDSSENALEQAKAELNRTNQSLLAVRSLSQLAGKLRKSGADKASDEALRKAGLSTLIADEELKQAWLNAATAEGYLSGNDQEEIKARDAVRQSINSLTKIQIQNEPQIFNQVKAFSYFISGQLNNGSEQDYRVAYQALKDSHFDPYNTNTENDIFLTDQDVELIHYNLIQSANIDINSKQDVVAKSFRKHLYMGLDVLLQSEENRLREADLKTDEIMLYIGDRRDQGYFTVESLENFSCDALKEIDKRWYNYPRRPSHFGFREQKKIWNKHGSPQWNSPPDIWKKIYIDLGWKTEESGIQSDQGYIGYNNLAGFTNLNEAKQGNLPRVGKGVLGWVTVFFSRVVADCSL